MMLLGEADELVPARLALGSELQLDWGLSHQPGLMVAPLDVGQLTLGRMVKSLRHI